MYTNGELVSEIILYQTSSKGKIKYLNIWTDGDELKREWGIVGTENPQSSSDTKSGKNIGRSNEVTPEEQAELEFERLVKRKMENGYVEDITEEVTLLSFSSPPKNLCPAKPIQKMPEDLPKDMILTLKRDGLRTLTFVDKVGTVRLFSRTMDEVSDLFPDIIAELQQVGLPKETILDGEMLFSNKNGGDSFSKMTSIYRSKPEKAIARQEEYIKDGQIVYYLFDMLFWAGKDMTVDSYKSRLSLLPEPSGSIQVMSSLTGSLKANMAKIKKSGGEGLVVYSRDYHNTINYDGKPKRPVGCWKSKMIHEDDMIVTGMEQGQGKNQGKLGNVDIAQYNSAGELVSWDKCGGGFSDEQRGQFWRTWKPKLGKIVIQVKFDERTSSS